MSAVSRKNPVPPAGWEFLGDGIDRLTELLVKGLHEEFRVEAAALERRLASARQAGAPRPSPDAVRDWSARAERLAAVAGHVSAVSAALRALQPDGGGWAREA